MPRNTTVCYGLGPGIESGSAASGCGFNQQTLEGGEVEGAHASKQKRESST